MLIAIAIAEKFLGLYSFHSQLYAVSWCSHSYSQWYEQPSARENSEKEWNTSRIFLFSCSPFFFQKNFTPWYVHFFWQRFTSNHLWQFLPFFLKISLQEMLIAFGNDHLRNRENGLMGINSLFPHEDVSLLSWSTSSRERYRQQNVSGAFMELRKLLPRWFLHICIFLSRKLEWKS